MSEPIANRKALGDVQDSWDSLVAAVEDLPRSVRRETLAAKKRNPHLSDRGAALEAREQTLAFGRTHLRSLVDAISLSWGRTKDVEMNVHRIHMALTEGPLLLLLRDDHIGLRARVAFLEAVERVCLAPTDKAVFERSREDASEGDFVPDTTEG